MGSRSPPVAFSRGCTSSSEPSFRSTSDDRLNQETISEEEEEEEKEEEEEEEEEERVQSEVCVD